KSGAGDGDTPRFEAPIEIADVKIRLQPFAADWDHDGHVDVIVSAASGEIVWIRNLGRSRFAPGVPLRVPAVPYSPFASVVDWNGDGDEDLLVGTAYGYTCWFERSFLEQGYSIARGRGSQPDRKAGGGDGHVGSAPNGSCGVHSELGRHRLRNGWDRRRDRCGP